MKYCAQCGEELCDTTLTEEEKDCLNLFYRFFKYERLAWKIGGIVFLIISLLFLGLSALVVFVGAVTEEAVMIMAFPFFLYGIVFLPIAIVGLMMVKKAKYHMDIVYEDAKAVIKRCNSVGMIVLGVLFNNIAAAFIITNFVMAKTKAKVLEEIARKQEKINM